MFRYDRLETLIAESGKSKVSLCEKIRKCPTYLRDAKKQKTNIKGETLLILARELNTSPEYLIGETDEKKPTLIFESELSEQEKEIIQFLRLVPPERQPELVEIVRNSLRIAGLL